MERVRLHTGDANLIRTNTCAVNSLSAALEATTNLNINDEVIAPILPYTIAGATYFSQTIITTGLVEINGVPVAAGTYNFSTKEGNKLSQKVLTTSGVGTVVILLQSVV